VAEGGGGAPVAGGGARNLRPWAPAGGSEGRGGRGPSEGGRGLSGGGRGQDAEALGSGRWKGPKVVEGGPGPHCGPTEVAPPVAL
jgi:hypothetical protein